MQFWATVNMRVTQKKSFIFVFYGSSLTVHKQTIKIDKSGW